MSAYHTREIPKGKLGEFSKIEEEWNELKDAHEQGVQVLEICELCDLLGSIDLYVKNKFNLSIEELQKMTKLTAAAFTNGDRK